MDTEIIPGKCKVKCRLYTSDPKNTQRLLDHIACRIEGKQQDEKDLPVILEETRTRIDNLLNGYFGKTWCGNEVRVGHLGTALKYVRSITVSKDSSEFYIDSEQTSLTELFGVLGILFSAEKKFTTKDLYHSRYEFEYAHIAETLKTGHVRIERTQDGKIVYNKVPTAILADDY